MPNSRIQSLTATLPYSLREAVNGYVDAVAAALPEIQKDARVEIAGERADAFLIVVAIRRIWSTINNQYWTMNDCIQIASRTDGRAVAEQGQVRGLPPGCRFRPLRCRFGARSCQSGAGLEPVWGLFSG